MRVLVCGGRDYIDDDGSFSDILNSVNGTWDLNGNKIKVIIHGTARGADTLADNWARAMKVDIEAYSPDWNKHGKKAGYLRNKRMLEEGKPDLVIAFPGGKGTANMVKLAREAGIEVREITSTMPLLAS